MKWFVGSFHLNGGQIEQHAIKKAISHVRCAGARVVTTELVGQQSAVAIAVTTELSQQQPKIFQCNDLLLVGDIRIDNRNDLLAKYRYEEKADTISDEIIILQLFARLGPEFIKEIVGEFAFIIWDRTCKTLFAARDQMGVKTLYWLQKGDQIWLASDLDLLQDQFTMTQLNPEYFTEFYLSNGAVDSEVTPFQNVHRVPGATWLRAERGVVRLENYWEITEQGSDLHYSSQDQYEEHLRDLLFKSVRDRLSTHSHNAVMMSGGLDSTTVFAIAKQLELRGSGTSTFPVCGVFDRFKECDEREYIVPILEMYETEAFHEVCDDYGLLKNFPHDAPFAFEPSVNASSHAFTSGIMRRARLSGTSTLLSGYAGDHMFAGSEASLADMVRSYQFVKAMKYSYEYSKAGRLSLPQVLWKYGLGPLLGRGLAREIIENRNDTFVQKVSKIKSFNQKEFFRQLSGTKARVYSDRVIGSEVGIDCHHPFLDRRLAEFLYRIPGSIRWSGGTTKYLLRHAMNGYLPQKVLWRANKTVHLPLTYQGLRDNWPEIYSALEPSRIVSLGWISREEWLRTLNSWRQGHEVRQDIWVLVAIELWMYRLEKRTTTSIAS